MNPEVKKLWVEALRSGEYRQGTGRLRSADKFCCLGVLCNLHAQANPEIAKNEIEPDYYMGRKNVLPPAVVEWADLPSANPFMDSMKMLAELNDGGVSFSQIADEIEAQL